MLLLLSLLFAGGRRVKESTAEDRGREDGVQQRQRLASQPWLVSRQMGALQCSVTLTLPLLLCAVLELSVCSALLFPPSSSSCHLSLWASIWPDFG